jgi:hypothetical protein
VSGTDGEDGGERRKDAASSDAASGGTQQSAEEPHDSLLAALHVTRHLRVGLAVGIGLAAVLYLPRLPAFDRSIEGAEGLYLGLAFVLAATTAGLVTAALSIKTFLAPVLDRSAWLRRGGMAAMLGGLGWTSTPLLAAASEAGTIGVGTWRTATSLATVAVLVGAIGIHSAVKPGAVAAGGQLRRIERAAYWVVLIGLVIAAANATGDAGPITTLDGGAGAGSGSGTGSGSAADGTLAATPFLLGALLASVAAIPFAATAELTRRLPRWRIRALQLGSLLGTLGIAWLVALGGWDWLSGLDASAAAIGLAVGLAPAGIGWTIAGLGLWTAAASGGLGSSESESTPSRSGSELSESES